MKIAQLCLTLCNSMDYRLHGILQARVLKWVTFPYSRGSSQPRDQTQVSHIAGGFFTSWATGKPLVSVIFVVCDLQRWVCANDRKGDLGSILDFKINTALFHQKTLVNKCSTLIPFKKVLLKVWLLNIKLDILISMMYQNVLCLKHYMRINSL